MNREEFDHAIRAAGSILDVDEILVIGSQAAPGTRRAAGGHPEVSDRRLTRRAEVQRPAALGVVLFMLLLGCSSIDESAGEGPTPTATVDTETTATEAPAPAMPYSPDSVRPGEQQAFAFEASLGAEVVFWLYVPEDHEAGENWPLILSLHGFLGFEPTLERVRGQSPLGWVNLEAGFPFVVLSPQAGSGPWAQSQPPLEELIRLLEESFSIDPDAQFLVGDSAGVVGVLQWAIESPDRFAGVAAIAGGASMNPADSVPDGICSIVDLPVWVAHSEADQEVPLEASSALVTALEECGSAVVQYTIYHDLNHAESIQAAYGSPALYDWMLGTAG